MLSVFFSSQFPLASLYYAPSRSRHLDNHSLWEGKTFAVRCFKIIMYSIQVREKMSTHSKNCISLCFFSFLSPDVSRKSSGFIRLTQSSLQCSLPLDLCFAVCADFERAKIIDFTHQFPAVFPLVFQAVSLVLFLL